jgi:hypothetical protein
MVTDDSVLELPPKIPYFASLVVVANARKAAVGKDILEFTVGKVKEVLEAGDVMTGKLLLRFLAGLARIVEDDGVLTVIGEIVSKIEGQEPNVPPSPLEMLSVGSNGQSCEIGIVDVTIHRCITQGTYGRIRCYYRQIDTVHGLSRHK